MRCWVEPEWVEPEQEQAPYQRDDRQGWRGGLMIPGVDLVAGYLFAWAVRKFRRVGAAADTEVNVLDAAGDKLHELVSTRLGNDSSLARLEQEAKAGVDSERTRRRVQDAVEQAVEDDPTFAAQLGAILAELAGGQSWQQVTHTGSVRQHNTGGTAIANTGVVGGDITVDGSVTDRR
jgi:hypothetical protein